MVVQVFDQDRNGVISETEWKVVMSELGGFSEPFIQDFFREIDVAGNGQIDYHEFAQMVPTTTNYGQTAYQYHPVSIGGLILKQWCPCQVKYFLGSNVSVGRRREGANGEGLSGPLSLFGGIVSV